MKHEASAKQLQYLDVARRLRLMMSSLKPGAEVALLQKVVVESAKLKEYEHREEQDEDFVSWRQCTEVDGMAKAITKQYDEIVALVVAAGNERLQKSTAAVPKSQWKEGLSTEASWGVVSKAATPIITPAFVNQLRAAVSTLHKDCFS